MNKKGFTLMELLLVVLIVSIVSVGAVISFTSIDDSTALKERENQNKEIQRSASLYLDLHDSTLKQFINDKYTLIKLYTLQAEGFIDRKLEDPVNKKRINANNSVIIYVKKYYNEAEARWVDLVDTCIANTDFVDPPANTPCGSTTDYYRCVANSHGETSNCDCDCLKKVR